jgi:hypothetical protein
MTRGDERLAQAKRVDNPPAGGDVGVSLLPTGLNKNRDNQPIIPIKILFE